jgi:DNA segregation ATPase FtsK/SpoIIIE-like protein
MLYAPGINNDIDELFNQAVKVVVQYDKASSSLLQRRLDIGYARAARLMDQLEASGVVSASDGTSKPRQVLVSTYEEFLSKDGKKYTNEPDDVFKLSGDYSLPDDLKLSRTPTASREQLADALKTKDFLRFKDDYPIILGYDEKNQPYVNTLSKIGNLFVTGNPQSNKENWIDTVLASFLLTKTPKELRLVLIDESNYLDFYTGIPHLLSPVITDMSRSVSALRWTMYEIARRMKVFTEAKVRSFEAYNLLPNIEKLPRILVVYFCYYADVESNDAMQQITSTSLRTGIHLFIVTNRMSEKNISVDVKSNIPNRAVFTVTSTQDSQVAGVKGAENLKEGEMFYKTGFQEPMKLKTIFIPEVNVKEVVEAVKAAN